MSENNGTPPNDNSGNNPKPTDKKKAFGTLRPLTAVQIISLIVPSSPVGAGACY